jgi:tetratricopeptide (TPR) repeat protein
MIGETVTALSYYEQSLDLHRRIGDEPGEARVTANIAIQFAQAAEFEKALSYLQKSKLICKKLGDLGIVAHISTNIGEVLSDLGRHQESLSAHQEALDIYEKIGNQTQVRRVLGNYAKALTVAGDIETAQETIDKVDMSLAEADIKLMLNWVQGKIYLSRAMLPEAKNVLEEIMDFARQSGNQYWSQKIL